MKSADPTVLGQYEVVGVLGRGGMGTVYEVRLPGDGQVLALKLLAPVGRHSDLVLESFRREFRLLSQLRHPNLIQVLDFGMLDDAPYFTMELVTGQPLVRVPALSVRPGATLWEEQNDLVLRLILQVLDGVECLHQHGIVHRDIKPANFLVSTSGIVKILDLGIALDQHSDSHRAMPLMGTVEYMSPEQIDGTAIDTRSDLFSLGVLLYEVTTGHVPFSGGDRLALASRIVGSAAPAIRSLHPDTPERLHMLIHKLLAHRPEQRFQSIAEVRAEWLELAAEVDIDLSQTAGPHGVRVAGVSAERLMFAPGWVPDTDTTRVLVDLLDGPGRLLTILGDAGSGKSRLVAELAAQAAGQDVYLAAFRATENDVTPYFPVLSLLEEAQRSSGGSGAVSDRRFQLHSACVSVLKDRARARRGLLVVDDAHFADEDTLDVLEFVVRELVFSEAGWSAVLLYPEPADPTHPLVRWLVRTTPGHDVETHTLPAVDAYGVETMVASMLGDVYLAGRLASDLWAETGGNPGCVTESIKAMVDGGALRQGPGGWDLAAPSAGLLQYLPSSVADAHCRRLASLGAGAQAVLRVAALLGSEFTYETLRLCLADMDNPAEGVVELLHSRILRRCSERREGQLAFVVPQIRHAVLKTLSDAEQTRLQRELCTHLEGAYSQGDRRVVHLLALHSPALEDRGKAALYLTLAGDVAAAALATARAADWYEQVLDVGQAIDDSSLARMLDVLLSASRNKRVVDVCRQRLEGSPQAALAAQWTRRMGEAQVGRGEHTQALGAFKRTLDLLGFKQPRSAAGLMLATGIEFVRHLPHAGWGRAGAAVADKAIVEALTVMLDLPNTYYMVQIEQRDLYFLHNLLRTFNVAHRAADNGLLGRAYATYGFMLLKLPRPPIGYAVRYLQRAERLLPEVTDVRSMTEICRFVALSYIILGHVGSARRVLDVGFLRSREQGFALGLAHTQTLLGMSYWSSGPVGTMERWGRLALEKAELIEDETFVSITLSIVALAEAQGGRMQSSLKRLQAGADRFDGQGRVLEPMMIRYVRAQALTIQAREDVTDVWMDVAEGYRKHQFDTILVQRCRTYAAMCLLRRDKPCLDTAAQWIRGGLKLSPQVGYVLGFARSVQAQLMALQGRVAEAVEGHKAATRLLEQHGALVQAAECHRAFADILERVGDRENAARVKAQLQDLVEVTGAVGLLGQADS